MVSGISNTEKSHTSASSMPKVRSAETNLLKSEMGSYHGPGTCTFYGTANTNQMLMEIMGLHLPGAAFINPGTKLRDALTQEAARRVPVDDGVRATTTCRSAGCSMNVPLPTVSSDSMRRAASTNHTIHLVAMAAAAGITLTWDDFSDLADSHAAARARVSQRARPT